MRVRAVAPMAGWVQGQAVDVEETAQVRKLLDKGLLVKVASSPPKPAPAPAPQPDPEPDTSIGEDLGKMTVTELRELAARLNVDLPAHATKPELIRILDAAI